MNATSSSGMVEDLPSWRREDTKAAPKAPRRSCFASPTAPRGYRTHRSVSFSPTCDITLIPAETAQDASSKSYTEMDVLLFKRARAIDVGRIRWTIAKTPLKAISRDHLYDCLGVEVLISPDLFRKVRQTKRDHVEAVLDEQAAQDRRGACDAEGLAGASAKSSAWARGRAEQMAANYLLIKDKN